jgi:hypothetical protein
VDGDLLPPYMGIRLERSYSTLMDQLVSALFSDRIAPRQDFDTWLTKLVCDAHGPREYVSVCRLIGVRIEVHDGDRVLHFVA